MKFTLNNTVAALVPEAIMVRVQNGVDTEFSAAVDAGNMEETAKWKGGFKAAKGEKAAVVKISRALKTKWELQANGPGRLILLSVYVDQIENEIGELPLGGLPDRIQTWFKRLESEVAKDNANKKPDQKPA